MVAGILLSQLLVVGSQRLSVRLAIGFHFEKSFISIFEMILTMVFRIVIYLRRDRAARFTPWSNTVLRMMMELGHRFDFTACRAFS